MSLRPSRPRNRKCATSHSSPPTPLGAPGNRACLVPVDEVPRQRLAPFTSQFHLPRVRSVFTLPDGRDLAQLHQPTHPDRRLDESHGESESGNGEDTYSGSHGDSGPSFMEPSSLDDSTASYLTFSEIASAELRRTRARAKREKQWTTIPTTAGNSMTEDGE